MFKNISFLIVGLLVICAFPQNSFAVAHFQNFSASISFTSDCIPKLTYNTIITPSTLTSGNIFKIGVKLQNSNDTSQDITETFYNVAIPANGMVTNSVINLTQTIVPNSSYLVTLYEYQGSNFITSSSPATVQPSNTGACSGTGQNQVSENTTNNSPSGISAASFDIDIHNPISVHSFPELVQTILEAMIKVGIPLLVVMIVYSGFLYLTALGNPGKIQSAHTMLGYTLLGGAILLAAWAIAQLIHTTLIEITASLITIFV